VQNLKNLSAEDALCTSGFVLCSFHITKSRFMQVTIL